MTAFSEYVRLILYPLLALLCLLSVSYFPRLKGFFIVLALFFAVFGVGLLVLTLGQPELNLSLRTWLVPLAQIGLVIMLVRALWLTNKRRVDS